MHNNTFNKLLIGIVILIVLVNVVIIGNFILKGRGVQIGGSSNYALLFTQPVTSLGGTVDSIASDNLVIQYASVDTEGRRTTTPITVSVNKNTQITELPSSVPYTFKAIPPVRTAKLSLSDVKQGDFVSVTTDKDLRTSSGTIEAKSIVIQPQSNNLSGTIESVQNNAIRVKGTVPQTISNDPLTPAVQKSYIVSISPQTEISIHRISTATGSATLEKATVSDLRAGMSVNVYYAPTTSETSVTGLLIQALPQTVLSPAAAPVASQSAINVANPTLVPTVAD